MIFLLSVSIYIYKDLKQETKLFNQSKNMLDYGLFQTFQADRHELTDYKSHHNFYLDIMNDKNIETFYCIFNNYSAMNSDNLSEQEESGSHFNIDSVDRNYLIKENIEILDNDGVIQNINEINEMFFLLP